MNLACLNENASAMVISLSGPSGIRQRLLDIGLTPGTTVKCLQTSALGDPTAYLIRGAVMAIRAEDAEGVAVLRVS